MPNRRLTPTEDMIKVYNRPNQIPTTMVGRLLKQQLEQLKQSQFDTPIYDPLETDFTSQRGTDFIGFSN